MLGSSSLLLDFWHRWICRYSGIALLHFILIEGVVVKKIVVLCACLSTIMKEELPQKSWKHWIIKRGPPCQIWKFWSFLLCGSLLLSLASPTITRFQSPSAICGPCFHQICLQLPYIIWGKPHQPNKTQVSSGRIAQYVLIGTTIVSWQW